MSATASSKARWAAFIAYYFLGMVSATAIAKAAPMLTVIGADFGMGLSTVGWIMSCFAVTGMIVAFPSALLIRKLGFRGCVAVSGASLIIGAALGYFATSTPVFLTARVIEGFGQGLITVMCPAAIVRLFEPSKRGLPMGIWATFMGVGAAVAYIGGPIMAQALGWRSLWMASVVLGIVATALALGLSGPLYGTAGTKAERAEKAPAPVAQGKPSMKSIVLLALSFFTWNLALIGAFSSFYPTYLQDAAGMSVQVASALAIAPNFVAMVAAPIAGPIIARHAAYKPIALVFLLIGAIGFCGTGFVAHPNALTIGLSIATVGLAAGVVPTVAFSLIPIYSVTPQRNDFGMALLAVFQNAGMFVGSAAFGAAVAATSWADAAHLLLIPLLAAGIVLLLLTANPKKLIHRS